MTDPALTTTRNAQKPQNLPRADSGGGAPQGPNWKLIAILVAIAALLVIVTVLGVEHTILLSLQDHFVELVHAAGPLGWIMLILLLLAHSFVPFPLEFAAVAAGATYGFVLGSLLTWIGTILGGALSFWLSRRYGRPFLDRALNEQQRDWILVHSKSEGAVALLVSRLLPFISFTLVSYAAGFTQVSWPTFLWTTALGMLPITLISVFYGANIDRMPIEWVIAIPLIGIVLVIGFYRFARKMGWTGKPVH